MRIYGNLKEAYKETERELVEMGVLVHPQTMQDKDIRSDDKFITKELQGYCYMITGEMQHVAISIDAEKLGVNMEFIDKEIAERLCSDWVNPGGAYLTRKDIWLEFLHKGKFAYTYNERLRDQVQQILYQLQKNPNTRQAVITFYDRHEDLANMGGIKRIPCSMYYQLLRRPRKGKEELDLIYTMRSCDLYTHMLYDMMLAMKFQIYMSHLLNIKIGNFTHFIGSLHAYKKDYDTKGVF